MGLNLAGVERVLALEEMMQAMQQRMERLARRAEQMEREMLARVDEVHRSYRRELVPWQPPGAALQRDLPDAAASFEVDAAAADERAVGICRA